MHHMATRYTRTRKINAPIEYHDFRVIASKKELVLYFGNFKG